jgi:protein SCO1/2
MNAIAQGSRLPRRALAWLAVAALLALLAALARWLGSAADHPQPADPGRWERLDADEPAPGFTLTDARGRRVRLVDLRGRLALVTFLYTNCTDVCPVLPEILARVDDALTATERARLALVGISVDPRRDTPEQLAQFLQRRGLREERWTLLTGTVAELTQAASDYGVVVRPDARGDLVHNTVFVLIDPRGRLRIEFHGLATPSVEIVRAVRELLAEPGS